GLRSGRSSFLYSCGFGLLGERGDVGIEALGGDESSSADVHAGEVPVFDESPKGCASDSSEAFHGFGVGIEVSLHRSSSWWCFRWFPDTSTLTRSCYGCPYQ